MNTKKLKLYKLHRYFFVILYTSIVFGLVDFIGYKELICPELIAILTGTLFTKKQIWNISKIQLIFLTCITSVIGVAIVKYLTISFLLKTVLGLTSAFFFMILFRTDCIPIIATNLIPIFLHINTWKYILFILLSVSIIVISQSIMEKFKIKSPSKYRPLPLNIKKHVFNFLILITIFIVISYLPFSKNYIYMLTPPVICTFFLCSVPNSQVRQKPINILFIMITAVLIGTICRFVCINCFNLPLFFSFFCGTIILFYVYDRTKIIFPPASGAFILSIILKERCIIDYPLEFIVGLVVIIPVTLFVFHLVEKLEKNSAKYI